MVLGRELVLRVVELLVEPARLRAREAEADADYGTKWREGAA